MCLQPVRSVFVQIIKVKVDKSTSRSNTVSLTFDITGANLGAVVYFDPLTLTQSHYYKHIISEQLEIVQKKLKLLLPIYKFVE